MAATCLVSPCLASAQTEPPAQGGETAASPCTPADAALAEHRLTTAREAYLDVLDANGQSPCAQRGLGKIHDDQDRVQSLCEKGAASKQAGDEQQADQAYADALEIDNESSCAKEGLADPPEPKTVKKHLEEWFSIAGDSTTAFGAVLLLVFGLPLILMLIGKAVRSLWKPSLAIRKLEDGGVDDKLGVAVRALIEERLMTLASAGKDARQRSGLDLDLVLADVDIFADEDDLAQAAGGVSDVPQLAIAMAIVNLISRLRWRYFAIDGELLPSGRNGEGLALALSKRNSLRARGALWTKTAGDWADAHPAGETAEGRPGRQAEGEQPPPPGADENGTPVEADPYYRLAVAAAAWVQFNVGRALDRGIDVLTASGESFARVGAGLEHHRRGELALATLCYRRALERDVDNVAALANLGIVCRDAELFGTSLELLARARAVLEGRYLEPKS